MNAPLASVLCLLALLLLMDGLRMLRAALELYNKHRRRKK